MLNFERIFANFFSVFILDFEHVNICWVAPILSNKALQIFFHHKAFLGDKLPNSSLANVFGLCLIFHLDVCSFLINITEITANKIKQYVGNKA